jgi:hypothetical protein
MGEIVSFGLGRNSVLRVATPNDGLVEIIDQADGETVTLATVLGTPTLSPDSAAAGSPGGYVCSPLISIWLAQLAEACSYAGLLANDPRGSEDPTTSELTFPLYSRQPVTWASESSNVIVIAAPLTWPGLVAGSRLAAVGFWSQPAGGALQAVAYLPDADGVLVNSTYSVAAGNCYLGVDAL